MRTAPRPAVELPVGKQSWLSQNTISTDATNLFTTLSGRSVLQGDASSIEESIVLGQRHDRTAAQTVVEYAQITAKKHIKFWGAHKHHLLSVVHEDGGQLRTCIEFPMILIYFTLFAAVFQIHYNTFDIYVQESLVRSVLTNPAKQVSTSKEIAEFLFKTAAPLVVGSNPDYRGPSSDMKLGRLKLIAGLRLTTVIGPAVPCNELAPTEANKFPEMQGMDCYPEIAGKVSDQAVFNNWGERKLQETAGHVDVGFGARRSQGRRLRNLQWSSRRSQQRKRRSSQELPWRSLPIQALRRLSVVKAHMRDSIPSLATTEKKYHYVVPVSMPATNIGYFSQYMQDIMGEEAMVLTAHFLVLCNGDEARKRVVSSVYIHWIFSRGGQIYTDNVIISTVLDVRPFVVGFMVCWAVLLIAYSLKASMRLSKAVKTGDCCSELLQFDNLFEWTMLVTGWLILLCLGLEWHSRSLFNDHLKTYEDGRKDVAPAMIPDYDISWSHKMHSTMKSLETYGGLAQFTVALYHIFLVVRLLIASSGHLRLAVVFNTLRRGFLDLMHLFIVLGFIFFAFVMAGHVLFGRRLPEFSTIKGSLGYCTLIILQRQYDLKLTEEDFITSSVWIFCFVLLLVMVVVNIVLAMIFGSYSEVQNSITAKDTIWHTAGQLWKQLERMSQWVPRRNLIGVLGRFGYGSVITVKKLQELCPGMVREQSHHLFTTVRLRMVTALLRGRKNALAETLASILLAIEDLRQDVHILASVTSEDRDTHMWAESVAFSPRAPSSQPERTSLGEDYAGPPADAPSWVEHALLVHLRRRQAAMDTLYLRMVQMDDHLQKRGMGASGASIPICEPAELPSRDGSKHLDPTLTGLNLKPMLTPGQARPSTMARLPRVTEKLTGITLMERLDRVS